MTVLKWLVGVLIGLSLSVGSSQEIAVGGPNKSGLERRSSEEQTNAFFRLTSAGSPDKAAFEALLRKGVDPNAFDHDGKCVLLEVVLRADTRGKGGPLKEEETAAWLEVAKLLLDSGANPNLPCPERSAVPGFTPLMAAAAHDLNDAVRLLLRYKADVNAQAKSGTTAMFFAARENNVEMLKMLVSAGGNVNAGTDHRPLHMAAMCGSLDAVTFLLASGADITVRTLKGNTPAEEAQAVLTAIIDRPFENADQIQRLKAVLELFRKLGGGR